MSKVSQKRAGTPGAYVRKRDRITGIKETPSVYNPKITFKQKWDEIEIREDLKRYAKQTFVPECKLPSQILTVINDHSNVVNNIRWHPTYGHLLASASLDHTARIWSVFDTPGEVVSVEHSEGVKDVQWTCDGTKLLSGGLDKYVNVSDLESGKIIHSYHHTEWISSLCPHPTNPNIFLSGATRRGIVCWDMRINRVVREYFGRFGEVQDMTFLDSNGYSFVSTAEIVRRNSQDQGIIVWDCKSGVRLSNQVYIEGYTCTCVRKHPIENVFIAQSAAGYIASFESTKPYRLDVRKRYEGHQANGFKIGCSFSGDGKTIVSGCSSGEVVFYDTKSSKVVKRMEVGAKEATLSVAWHPLLVSTVAVSSWDGSIRILQ